MISKKRCVLAFLFCKSSLQTNTQTEGSRPQSLHSSAAAATSLHLLFRWFPNQLQVVALQLSPREPRCSRACLSFRTDKSRLFQEGHVASILPLTQETDQTSVMHFSVHDGVFSFFTHTQTDGLCVSRQRRTIS